MNILSVDERLSALEKKIDAPTSLIDKQIAPKFVNHNGGQGNSSYNYKEQVQPLSNNDGIYALLEEDIRKCNLVFQNLKEEIQEPSLAEIKKIEYATKRELSMEKRPVDDHHQQTKFGIVLIGIDKFNFPIDLVTLGKEEDNQASTKGRPYNGLSQAWIDT